MQEGGGGTDGEPSTARQTAISPGRKDAKNMELVRNNNSAISERDTRAGRADGVHEKKSCSRTVRGENRPRKRRKTHISEKEKM